MCLQTRRVQQRRAHACCPLPEVQAGAGCSHELAVGVEIDVDGIACGIAAARHDVPAEAKRLDAGGIDLLGALPAQAQRCDDGHIQPPL